MDAWQIPCIYHSKNCCDLNSGVSCLTVRCEMWVLHYYHLQLATVSSKPTKAPLTSILSRTTARSPEKALKSSVILGRDSSTEEADNHQELNRNNFFSLKHKSTCRPKHQWDHWSKQSTPRVIDNHDSKWSLLLGFKHWDHLFILLVTRVTGSNKSMLIHITSLYEPYEVIPTSSSIG